MGIFPVISFLSTLEGRKEKKDVAIYQLSVSCEARSNSTGTFESFQNPNQLAQFEVVSIPEQPVSSTMI